jgi:hypothetical protein
VGAFYLWSWRSSILHTQVPRGHWLCRPCRNTYQMQISGDFIGSCCIMAQVNCCCIFPGNSILQHILMCLEGICKPWQYNSDTGNMWAISNQQLSGQAQVNTNERKINFFHMAYVFSM